MFRVAVALAIVLGVDGIRRNRGRTFKNDCGVKGASAPSSLIVNGQDATECEWRWQAQLKRFTTFCGGTLVSPQWVLTAAHCANLPTFNILLGSWNTSRFSSSGNVQTRRAVKLHKHPSWKMGVPGNDFMMVKLDRPVEVTSCVAPACLPAPGADVPPGSKCWITGWGNTKGVVGVSPKILQKAEVTVISNEDCVQKFSYSADQIDDSMLCAQGRTGDGEISGACRGDSGGPLVCEAGGRWTVYGATSFGLGGCAATEYPGVWSRVHKEVDWIQGLIDGNEPA